MTPGSVGNVSCGTSAGGSFFGEDAHEAKNSAERNRVNVYLMQFFTEQLL